MTVPPSARVAERGAACQVPEVRLLLLLLPLSDAFPNTSVTFCLFGDVAISVSKNSSLPPPLSLS